MCNKSRVHKGGLSMIPVELLILIEFIVIPQ